MINLKMKEYKIDTLKKKEILNDLKQLANEIREDICFDCMVIDNENDFIEVIEECFKDSDNSNKNIEEFISEFVNKILNNLSLSAKNTLEIQYKNNDFSKYIDATLKYNTITNFEKLEEVLSKKVIAKYFEDQFLNNRENILSYLSCKVLINEISNISETDLYNETVHIGVRKHISNFVNLYLSSEYSKIEQLNNCSDKLLFRIPF